MRIVYIGNKSWNVISVMKSRGKICEGQITHEEMINTQQNFCRNLEVEKISWDRRVGGKRIVVGEEIGLDSAGSEHEKLPFLWTG